MWLTKKTHYAISRNVLGISMLVWVLLLINPGNIMTIAHCKVPTMNLCNGGTIPTVSSIQELLKLNSFSSRLIGWAVMIAAMMLPKLINPIKHIYIKSLKRYRFRLAVLFVLGYLIAWMLAGVILTILVLYLNLLFPLSYLPAVGIGLITAVYQCSPLKQRFLNLGHNHWILPAFGFPAFRGALNFGFVHGVWCVGAGWLLMLFPMLLTEGHNIAMLVATFMMISEHLEHPKPLRWGFNPRLKLLGYLTTQVKAQFMYSRYYKK